MIAALLLPALLVKSQPGLGSVYRMALPLSAAGFIATFAGLIYHYIGIGPNKEVDDDEEKHDE